MVSRYQSHLEQKVTQRCVCEHTQEHRGLGAPVAERAMRIPSVKTLSKRVTPRTQPGVRPQEGNASAET